MSELSEIKKDIADLRTIVVEHVTKTETYRMEKDKLIESIKATVWDKEGNPGLATKVDRLNEIEKNRKWVIRAISTGMIGLILEWVSHIFKK